jgi:competence protein ComEA
MSEPKPIPQPPTDDARASSDQLIIALAVTAALVSGAVYYLFAGGASGLLISIDAAKAREAKFAVDINTADWPELAQLPEIGEVLAKRIVETRAALGPYSSIEDLQRVSGIGAKTLDLMRPYLLPVADPPTEPES